MAIGDTIEIGTVRSKRSIYRFDAQAGPAAISAGLVEKAAFTPSATDAAAPPPSRLAHLKPFGRSGKLLTLTDIADRVCDVFRAGVERAGGVAVQVPYPHLALVAGFQPSESIGDIEEALRQALDRKWAAYVDPIVGIRPRLFRDPERSNERLSLFIGEGVFMPRQNESPVGRVEIALADGSGDWVMPRLPDGSPAGLYRGQGSFTFAARTDLAPAVCGLIDDPHHRYVLARQPPGQQPDARTSGDLRLDPIPVGRLDPRMPRPEPVGDPSPPDGYDAGFVIRRDGQDRLRMRVVRDERSAALHSKRPTGRRAVLEVVGILAPEAQAPGRQIKRWWLDLDGDGHLVGAAWTRVAQSVVFVDQSVESYNWRSNRWRVGSGPQLVPEFHDVDGRRRLLIRRPDHPLGFLVPPASAQPVVFDATGTGSRNVFHLDWLDYAGAVQIGPDSTIRLCDAWAGAVATLSDLQVPSCDAVSAKQAGDEFFVGPLRVRVGARP